MTKQPTLLAGAAQIDITPPPGTHLAGSGCGDHRPAQMVIDPLFARAIVFESAGEKVCLVTLDVTILAGDYVAMIRKGITDATGIPGDRVMVHALQTHSAPSLGYCMLDPDFPLAVTPETEYLHGAERACSDRMAAGAIEAATQAAGRLVPARIGVGRGLLDGFAFNRRGIRRDGSLMMPKPMGRVNQPLGITDLCCLEGPMDPEVGVVCVQDLAMKPIAFLLHHTCHPVHVFGDRLTYCAVSSDWPGTWSAGMQATFGHDVVPLVINGCCGNINPWHPFDPDCLPDHRRMGRALTELSRRIVEGMAFDDHATVASQLMRVPLSYRDIPAARLAEVDRILAANPDPPRDESGQVDGTWFRAASTKSVVLCREREPEFQYELHVVRIGQTAVVGLPGEPFVEGQLALKTGAAAPYVFPAHLTGHYVGYLPTREAYARGGHEANEDVTYWAKLAPGSLETVIGQAQSMVSTLFG